MYDKNMVLKIARTKKGYPALWEQGGGYSNTGGAMIIAKPDGAPKKPLYIRRRGSLACEEHALFRIMPKDLVIMADHHRYDYEVAVYRIVSIDSDYAQLSRIHEFSRGEWDKTPPASIMEAVEAAMNKAADYHCRVPYWYVED